MIYLDHESCTLKGLYQLDILLGGYPEMMTLILHLYDVFEAVAIQKIWPVHGVSVWIIGLGWSFPWKHAGVETSNVGPRKMYSACEQFCIKTEEQMVVEYISVLT